MRGIAIISALFAVFAASSAVHAQPEDAIGRWSTPTRHGIIEIAMCGPSICGHLVASDAIRANPDSRDTKNGDAALRSRPLKGLLLLGGFHRMANGWGGGTIYNPDDGGTYHATITVTGTAPQTITLKGCIVWPLCKNQTWQRIG